MLASSDNVTISDPGAMQQLVVMLTAGLSIIFHAAGLVPAFILHSAGISLVSATAVSTDAASF